MTTPEWISIGVALFGFLMSAYSLRKSGKQAKKLEKVKHELGLASVERNLKFTIGYTKGSEVLRIFYAKFTDAHLTFYNLLDGSYHPKTEEQRLKTTQRAMEKFNDVMAFHIQNSLDIPSSCEASARKLQFHLNLLLNLYNEELICLGKGNLKGAQSARQQINENAIAFGDIITVAKNDFRTFLETPSADKAGEKGQ